MIAESVRSLLNDVNQLESLSQTLDLQGRVDALRESAEEVEKRLTEFEVRKRIADEAGLEIPAVAGTLRYAIGEFASGLRESLDSEEVPRIPRNLGTRALEELREWRTGWDEVWQAFVDERSPTANESFLNDMGVLLDARDAAEAVILALGKINDRRRRYPTSSEELAALDEAIAEAEQGLKDLLPEPEEVSDFLLQALRGGAPLSALTPEVDAWLRSNGLEDSIRIVAGGSRD